ncbi:glycosyltransferase [bacterium]|nr:glycosyltransferase [bacterium]
MLKEFVSVYGTLSGFASVGLARIQREGNLLADEELPSVAVVVAARDEEQNLPDLIAALSAQNYPEEKLDFFLVDDESRDGTLAICKSAEQRNSRFHALESATESDIGSPKKRALDTGIRAANADWILTTDADCIPGPGWVRAMLSFARDDIGVIAGYSPLVGARTISQWMLEGESWSSAALCAAGIGLGFPFNAFGRNLAFRRKVYLNMGGYAQHGNVASGDDDLFMQRIAARTDWKVAFAADPRSFVPSKVSEPGRVFNTKVRHMSVGPKYAPGWVFIGLIGNILFLGLALATVMSIVGLASRPAVAKAWKTKLIFDTAIIVSAARVLGNPARAVQALITMSFAPFALWAIWPRALFGTVRWKGRKFERNRAERPADA